MNQEFAKKWSAALRSGKYEQGFDRLRSGDKFCAMGVLADVINPEGWKKNVLAGGMMNDGQGTRLTHRLVQACEAHCGQATGHLLIGGIYVSELNDKQRLTFNAIANLIDTHWETI